MRILIDECIDPRVKKLFLDHEVKTVHDMGWDQLADGPLLLLAQDRFDVLVTIDRGLEFQQNLKKLRLGVIVVMVPKNQLIYYESLAAELRAAVEKARPGQVVHIMGERTAN
jgi:predicted nuclease of predicted toxin-antitoxin system